MVWKEEVTEAVLSTLRAAWGGGRHPSLRRLQGKWILRGSPVKTGGGEVRWAW